MAAVWEKNTDEFRTWQRETAVAAVRKPGHDLSVTVTKSSGDMNGFCYALTAVAPTIEISRGVIDY